MRLVWASKYEAELLARLEQAMDPVGRVLADAKETDRPPVEESSHLQGGYGPVERECDPQQSEGASRHQGEWDCRLSPPALPRLRSVSTRARAYRMPGLATGQGGRLGPL